MQQCDLQSSNLSAVRFFYRNAGRRLTYSTHDSCTNAVRVRRTANNCKGSRTDGRLLKHRQPSTAMGHGGLHNSRRSLFCRGHKVCSLDWSHLVARMISTSQYWQLAAFCFCVHLRMTSRMNLAPCRFWLMAGATCRWSYDRYAFLNFCVWFALFLCRDSPRLSASDFIHIACYLYLPRDRLAKSETRCNSVPYAACGVYK